MPGNRKMAAILVADVAGYSKLIGLDEEGTVDRVKRGWRDVVEPTIADHDGRVVKYTGDGFLAEFNSAVQAVRCAVVIQQSMSGRNASHPKQYWIQYRIGIHFGDIISDDDGTPDIYGDGVNVAARLQGLAKPGGLYISEGVYGLIKHKLVVGYRPLGDHRVKNITEPITVYQVLPDPDSVQRIQRLRRLAVAAGVVATVTVVGGVAVYWRSSSVAEPPGRLAETVKSAPAAAQPMPPKPPATATSSVALSQIPPAAPPPPVGIRSPELSAAPPPSASAAAPDGKPGAVEPKTAMVAPRAVPSPRKEPEMVELPGGSFMMGGNDDPSERPAHRVTVKPFSIGRFPVTVAEWQKCVSVSACDDVGAGDDPAAPVTNVSWSDAAKFAAWLSKETGKAYRLPTEAEWEYAARANTSTKYWWGNEVAMGVADCKGCGTPGYDARHPTPVGQFPPNPFGLHDMTGTVAEWVSDCWHRDYHGAPANGSSWDAGDCRTHVLRGGSWENDPSYMRSASREWYDTTVRYPTHGFRVARGDEKP
jgi:formylglycine-generating enzyme required for sulfatase activity/class 3 adenylate cyclase